MAKRIDRGSQDFKDRAARLLPRFKAREQKAYGRRFISLMGLDSRGGGFNRGFGGGFGGRTGRSSFAGFDIQAGSSSAPLNFSPDVADRVTRKSNANISTIINQLNSLVRAADRIGAITKDQQSAILDQIAAAKRVAKATAAPAPPPIPEQQATGPTKNLTEVDQTIQKLVVLINSLTNTIKEKQDEADGDGDDSTFMERFLDNMGFDSDIYRRDKKRKAGQQSRVDPEQLLDKNGKKLTGAARDSRIKKITKDRAAGLAPLRDARPVGAPGISSTMGQVSRSFTQGVSRAASIAAAGPSAVKASIKASAGPIVRASVGKIGARSIPIAGAAIGAGAAISRIMDGDWKGAGLDLASGFGSIATAIPLVVASVARDVYNNVFGIQPEEDPQFSERIGVVNDTVKELVEDSLKEKVEPKSTPTEKEVKDQLIPKNVPKTEADAKREAGQSVASTAPPANAPGATPAPGGGGGQSFPAAKGSSEYFTGKPESPSTTTPLAGNKSASGSMVSKPPSKSKGADIMNASTPPAPPPPTGMLGYNQDVGRFLPQQSQTNIAGRMGVGNVPNPDYIPSGKNNMGDLFKLMFFNVNYQEQ